jgi:hypothetical protein
MPVVMTGLRTLVITDELFICGNDGKGEHER